MNQLPVIFEECEKIKDEAAVQKIIAEINAGYQNKTVLQKYVFEINGKKYSAKIIQKKGMDQVLVRKNYGFKAFLSDAIDIFLPFH